MTVTADATPSRPESTSDQREMLELLAAAEQEMAGLEDELAELKAKTDQYNILLQHAARTSLMHMDMLYQMQRFLRDSVVAIDTTDANALTRQLLAGLDLVDRYLASMKG